VVVALLFVVVVLGAGCSSSDPTKEGKTTPSPRSETVRPTENVSRPEPQPSSSATTSELLYLRGTTLFSLDLERGTKSRLGGFATQDVFAYGQDFVTVEDGGPTDDFATRPFLTVRDRSGAAVRSLGSGYAPLVSTDDRLAFLRQSAPRECEGETCSGGLRVMVVGPPGAKPRELLGPGDWTLLAWAGEDLIVGDAKRPDNALLVDPSGGIRALEFAPNEIWDGTRDGIVVVRGGASVFDKASGEVDPLPVNGTLADGAIEVSRGVAVELSGPGSRLVELDLYAHSADPVPGSKNAMGPVLVSPTDDSFAFVRAVGLQLEALVCTSGRTCATVLRWAEGLTPLAFR
jgi:hypothetical protein